MMAGVGAVGCNPKPETQTFQNPKPEITSPKPEAQNSKFEARNPKPETLTRNPFTRNPLLHLKPLNT